MSKPFIILLMVFCHIIDDYCLQKLGCLADLKQRSWWEKNAPDYMYHEDYIAALAMHGFSWAFMVMLPVAAYMNFNPSPLFYFFFVFNWIGHSLIDHLKANKKKINLLADQTFHFLQIMFTARMLLW